MPPKIALIAYIVIVIWLLKIEKKHNPLASYALWVPTFWMLIMGSRPVGSWFNTSMSSSDIAEGSAYDRFVLNMLILLALWFLARRKFNWSLLLKDNPWLILLYVYLGTSVLWSDFTYVSIKRWTKISGTVVVACVILSEKQPLQAMESVFRRCAYVLIPLSLLLIKYFPVYGIEYSSYEGTRMGTGVTTHKNSLGQICALSAFFLILAVNRKWRAGELFRSRLHTIADVLVIGIALFLLFGGGGTYSATSILVFEVGIVCLLVFSIWKYLTEYVANHLKTFMVVGILLFIFLNYSLLPIFTSILGRSESLTGRTDIWSSVLAIAGRNPILGMGYGGYWGVQEESFKHQVMQSHNGYIDVYLQVGIVGITFLFMFFLEFCGKVRRELNHVFDWGMFGVSFLAIVLLYDYSEASFIAANYIWSVTVLLSVVFSVPVCIQTENFQRFNRAKNSIYL